MCVPACQRVQQESSPGRIGLRGLALCLFPVRYPVLPSRAFPLWLCVARTPRFDYVHFRLPYLISLRGPDCGFALASRAGGGTDQERQA